MSDTPRTDRVIKNCNGWHHVPIERARELERELNDAKARIARLEAALKTCDHNFSRSAPDEGSRNGDSWKAVREALGRPNPWEH